MYIHDFAKQSQYGTHCKNLIRLVAFRVNQVNSEEAARIHGVYEFDINHRKGVQLLSFSPFSSYFKRYISQVKLLCMKV